MAFENHRDLFSAREKPVNMPGYQYRRPHPLFGANSNRIRDGAETVDPVFPIARQFLASLLIDRNAGLTFVGVNRDRFPR
jgi:hypothetical protein